MLHESFVANYRGRQHHCRETSGTGSRVAFAKSNPYRNVRPTGRQTIARCRLTSVRGSQLVALRAGPYPSSIDRGEWCLEGGGAPRAISISYAMWSESRHEDVHCPTPFFRHEESTHQNRCNKACRLRPVIWHASVCSSLSRRITHFLFD